MQNDWLTQLVLKRRTIIRRAGTTERFLVLGVSVGQLGFMYPLRETKKMNQFKVYITKTTKPIPFVILRLDDWVVQAVVPVGPMSHRSYLNNNQAR